MEPQFLTQIPPMGIYETLYAFQSVFGVPMGEDNTHPWSQGFPLTSKLPSKYFSRTIFHFQTLLITLDGPELPSSVENIDAKVLKYNFVFRWL